MQRAASCCESTCAMQMHQVCREDFGSTADCFSARTPKRMAPAASYPLPEAGSFAKSWESEASIRHRVLSQEHPYMTRWVSTRTVGMPSCKAMALNIAALECIARIWCPLSPYPRAIPIEFLHGEAWGEGRFRPSVEIVLLHSFKERNSSCLLQCAR